MLEMILCSCSNVTPFGSGWKSRENVRRETRVERFDVAIVGAGPGASVAAYILGQAGLSVVMFGGALYTTVLQRLFPDFYQEEQCVERAVTEKRFSLLAKADEISVSFRYPDYPPPYYNHSFTALRARFDRWLPGKAEEAGAVLITSTAVDEVLKKDDQIIGVRARREGGEVQANVVIAADGANSLLAQQAGLCGELPLRYCQVIEAPVQQ